MSGLLGQAIDLEALGLFLIIELATKIDYAPTIKGMDWMKYRSNSKVRFDNPLSVTLRKSSK